MKSPFEQRGRALELVALLTVLATAAGVRELRAALLPGDAPERGGRSRRS